MYALLLLSLAAAGVGALDNGLARTPPRGFRTWNQFGARISQQLMAELVDAMVSKKRTVNGVPMSLADLGFTDVGIDDGWQACHSGVNGGYHDADGTPLVNSSIFPDLKAVTAYAHSHNLTSGWYGNNCICADKSNSILNFQGDVKALIEYGFDSVKYDSCGGEQDIQLWESLINATGKRVLIENCHNGPWLPQPPRKPNSPAWCPFHFYRSSTDIMGDYGVVMGQNLQTLLPLAAANLSFPGCWAYADMLEVGVTPGLHRNETGLTWTESRSHFGAWAITSNPLVLGLDVRNDTTMDAVWPIISNTEALAVNSAWAGSSGTRILADTAGNVTWTPCGFWPTCGAPGWEVWSKPLPDGAAAVLVLNHRADVNATVPILWASVPGLACGASPTAPSCTVRDVWAHADLGTFALGITASNVAPHDSVFLTVKPAALSS